MAQLVERPLPTHRGPRFESSHWQTFKCATFVYCKLYFERTKIKRKTNNVTSRRQRKEQRKRTVGGSLGLVVMGGDSCSKGCEFESRHRILDGYFSHLFVVKIVMCV